ncbi:heterokaryon incompatibility protein-domain-containing protein [Phaeosphaeria sp. MPI-PUGE-AT-0046c]|nr:heterokaryon incompatibility protein-domain-containing protein [Phaeosphaeria sp. MPI-PUGE-AT-0046c]
MATSNPSPYQPLKHDGDAKDRIRLLSLAPGDYDDPIVLTFSTRVLPPARDDLTEVVRLIGQDFYLIDVVFAQLAQSWLSPDVLRNLKEFGDNVKRMHKERMLQGPPSSDTVQAIQLAKVWLDIRKGKGLGFFGQALGTKTIVALEDFISSTVTEETPYEALSYTWGLELSPIEVFLDGCSMQITHNLDVALRHLRDGADMKIMWIDALCINQSDVAERSSQVQLMDRIYATAERTIVWLGPAANESNVVMQKFEEKVIVTSDILPIIYFTYVLLSRPWWSRVWVLQEVALSKSVFIHCGMHSLPLDIFLNRVDCLPDPEKVGLTKMIYSVEHAAQFFAGVDPTKLHHKFAQFLPHIREADYERVLYEVGLQLGQWRAFSKAAIIVRRGLRSSRAPTSLSTLVELTRTFNATDPRDKVYALLGLCAFNGMSAFKTHRITPDYARSVASTFSEAMAIILMDDFWMSYPQWTLHLGRDDVPDLPSWVPNIAHTRVWERDAKSASIASKYCPDYKLVKKAVCDLTGSESKTLYPRYISFSDDFSHMHTVGHLLGVVKNRVALRADSLDAHEILLENVSVLQDFLSTESIEPMTAVALLLGRPGKLMDHDIQHMTNFGDPLESIALEDIPSALLDKQFLWDVVHSLSGQTVFVTDTGCVGRSVGDFEEGDVVAGLFGIDLIFILKRADGGRYRMVNPAHVANHVLSPPWREKDQRFRKRKRMKTRFEEKFTIV